MRATSLGFLALFLVACGESPPPVTDGGVRYPAHCENVNPLDCLLPWPSSFYLADDPSTETGRRIAIPEEAMPRSRRGSRIDPSRFERFDGFSPAGSAITSYGLDIDDRELADEDHIDASLSETSRTVILDAETDELVAHFAEIDRWGHITPERRPLYIRPATRLQEGHRYIVAVRDLHECTAREGGMPANDCTSAGPAIEPSPYFRALRDGAPLPEAADIESRRAHFEDVFGHLEAAGIERSTLLEAWDFETASGESAWGEMVAIRDAALLALETNPPICTVTRRVDDPTNDPSGFYADEDEIWRVVEGTVRVPLFLGGIDAASVEESSLNRDANGNVLQNGFAEVPFVAKIPMSVHARVSARGAPAPVLDYGHGLFGDRFETNSSWFRNHIQETEVVSVAIDWWGMASDDLARVTLALQNLSQFHTLGERLEQAMVNHIVLQRAFRTTCAALPELQIPLTAGGLAPAIDPTQTFYYGNSQGGIFGLTLAALGIDVTRYASGVGGMSYSIMIPRSTNWQTYGAIMGQGYPDGLVRSLAMQMVQTLWDVAEPATYVPHIVSDPLPCSRELCPSGATPIHQVLMQIGRHDAQVANVTTEIAARTAGIGYATPAPYAPWNLTPLRAAMGESLGTSALVIYDIPGSPARLPGTRDPGEDNPAHGGVRRSPAAIEQIRRFQLEGEVIQTCDGICDPT